MDDLKYYAADEDETLPEETTEEENPEEEDDDDDDDDLDDDDDEEEGEDDDDEVESSPYENAVKVLTDSLSVVQELEPCREMSLAITKIEEAILWVRKRQSDVE